MRSSYLKSALKVLLVSVFLMAFSAIVSAQGGNKTTPEMEAEGHIATLWKIWPKPGQQAQFEAAIKNYAAWRKSAGETFVWHIYQPVVGNDLGHYIIRSGAHTWADMDSNEAWAVQAKAEEAYATTVGPFAGREEHYFSELDTKHSNWIESPDYKYFSVTNYSVKPGMYGDRLEALDKIQKAVASEKWPYPYSINENIGGSGGISIVVPMKSYAEMAEPDPSLMKILAKSLASESEAKATMKQFSSTINESENTIYLLRPDLSTPK